MTLVHRLLSCAVLLGGLLAFSGCGTTVSSSSDQDSNRTLTTAANTNWVLSHWTSANGEKQTVLPPAPTLLIGYEGRISGRSGVNTYAGTARIVRGQLDWGNNLGVTRMAGSPELMASETRYLNDLQATQHVTISGNRLIFTGKKPLRLEFVRAHP